MVITIGSNGDRYCLAGFDAGVGALCDAVHCYFGFGFCSFSRKVQLGVCLYGHTQAGVLTGHTKAILRLLCAFADDVPVVDTGGLGHSGVAVALISTKRYGYICEFIQRRSGGYGTAIFCLCNGGSYACRHRIGQLAGGRRRRGSRLADGDRIFQQPVEGDSIDR